MIQNIKYMLANEILMPLFIAGVAIFALAAAFIGEYVFGLEPCILCIYQRWPYAVVIGLTILAAVVSTQDTKRGALIVFLCGQAFFVNSLIAIYHTGVEQHWWKSHLEGCAIPDLGENITDVLAAIEAAKPVRCDEIPWADPILGLSMANYNIMLCFGMFVLCSLSATLMMRKANGVLD